MCMTTLGGRVLSFSPNSLLEILPQWDVVAYGGSLWGQ